MSRLNSRGDTIVEVLIALAITSLLIVGAFATSNRSLKGARQSQERAEAMKMVESQLEALRSISSTVGFSAAAPASPVLFCLDFSAVPPTIVSGFTGTIPDDFLTDTMSQYPTTCKMGQDGRYFMSISRSAGDSHDFTVRARWKSVATGLNENISILYELY